MLPDPPESSDPVAGRWHAVQERTRAACAHAGRLPTDVTVVAVTKSFPVEFVRKACAAGLRHIGENRVQEALDKFADDWIETEYPGTCLHLVGHLQSNKVKKGVRLFSSIDSVDSLELARLISREAASLGRKVRILFEVNTSGEVQKFGLHPEEVSTAVEEAFALPGVEVSGLMTVGPNVSDEDAIRESFRLLRDTFETIRLRLNPPDWTALSMGMSSDFEIAIEEGATEVRLGTVLFGHRESP